MTADSLLTELIEKIEFMEIETGEDRDELIGLLEYYIKKLDDEKVPYKYAGVDEDLAYEIQKDLMLEAES